MQHNTSTDFPERGDQAKHSCCPHYDCSGLQCTLITDGLFLPVEQHVHAYCLAIFYPSCSSFQRLAGEGDASDGEQAPFPENRRRSLRVPDHYLFRFSEITSSDQAPGFREDDAWTVDLSAHGIRFASKQFLPPGTRLQYELDPGLTGRTAVGLGRVVWSVPLENAPFFHSGIAFEE